MRRLFLLCFLLAGCMPSMPKLNLSDEVQIKAAIVVKYDDYEKVTRYEAPYGNVFPGGTYREKVFLRATKKDSVISTVQIYVNHTYQNDWRFYDRAYDINGQEMRVNKIDAEVLGCKQYIGCTYQEHLGVNIDIGYLEKSLDSGIKFKVVGSGGQQEFQLSPEYVRAFYLRLTDG